MSIYLLIILSFILILLLGKIKSIRLIYVKSLIIPLLCSLFIICLIIFSDTAVKSAVKGINLWLTVVFPSLFPFFVGSELLNKTGIVRALGILLEPVMRPLFNVPGCGSFAFAMGITSGYPIGAKITAGMREEKLLTRAEAERLLTFTNNSGPLFIIGAVSVGMYNMPQIGLFLLTCHILACISVGILFRFYRRSRNESSYRIRGSVLKKFKTELSASRKEINSSFGSILGDAVRNSVNMILAIGGFIIFFSVIINLLLETGVIGAVSGAIYILLKPTGIGMDVIKAAVSGFFEITTGTNMASKASGASIIQQLTVTSMIIGWAGLSVHSQVISIVSHTDISIKPYLSGKFIQGIFAGIYTYAGIKIAGHSLMGTEPAFVSHATAVAPSWSYYFLNSCRYFFTLIAVITVFTAFYFFTSYILSKLKRR